MLHTSWTSCAALESESSGTHESGFVRSVHESDFKCYACESDFTHAAPCS